MSDLSRISDCQEWIRAWRTEASPERAGRVISRAAEEQAANLKSAEGKWPARQLREYARSVKLLQRAALVTPVSGLDGRTQGRP